MPLGSLPESKSALEFITEETGHWNWPSAFAVGIWTGVSVDLPPPTPVLKLGGSEWSGMVMKAPCAPGGLLPGLPIMDDHSLEAPIDYRELTWDVSG